MAETKAYQLRKNARDPKNGTPASPSIALHNPHDASELSIESRILRRDCSAVISIYSQGSVTYYGAANKVVLFKCDWYDTERGIRVHRDHGLVDVRYKSRLNTNEPFILAQQAQQVYYTTYPCKSRETDGWWAVCKTKARNFFNIPSADTSNITVSSDIDIYQEDEITDLSIVQADEDLDIPNLLVDFSQYEMLNDDELLKLQQRLEEAVVEDEEEEEQDGEDAEDEEEDEFEDNIDESTEEENEFELSNSEND